MRYIVPEDIGGELQKFEGPCKATLEKIILGKSQKGNPKATLRYVITEDLGLKHEGDGEAIGQTVLETLSLQPQSMWRVNEMYKQATGERLPQGDYDQEGMQSLLDEALAGSDWNLMLELKVPDDGSSTVERTTVVKRELA